MARETAKQRRVRLGRRENELRAQGFELVAGVDEAGAGPLAGPLVAAAVILRAGARLPGVNDSKQLTAPQREQWAGAIREQAVAWAVEAISAAEIDRIGPFQAAIVAMTRAVLALSPPPDFVLSDARRLPDIRLPQQAIVRGDAQHLAIAAASILAKTERDQCMRELDGVYPEYGFARHKGYGTSEHLEALLRHGPCPEHRRRYAPVRATTDAPQRRLFDDPLT
jgi:ribonuclease HII